MSRHGSLRGPSRRIGRSVLAVVGATLLTVSLAIPAGAATIGREHYTDDYAFSFDDCGFWVDVTGHAEGTAHLRVGKGDQESAFFLHNNYAVTETWTRRDTGEWFTIEANGLFQETTAVHIEGTVFEFTSVNAGQPFTLTDSDGNVVYRDRGVIREVLQFDTLGDDVPGGEFVADIDFSVRGPHPGLAFDPCALLA
jgi:hypothetical protein